MRYLPLGVGDAFTARYYTCCLAVEAEGSWLLLDCPHPIRKMMRDGSQAAGLKLDVGDVAAICLSHQHADHASGLEGFAFFSHFVLKRRATLVAHPTVTARLWSHTLSGGMDTFGLEEIGEERSTKSFEDYFDLRPVTETEPVRIGPFTIECRPTIHPIPTTAIRVSAGGKALGYSGDTYFDPGLIEWLGAADVMVHETAYGIHTPYAKLADLPSHVRQRMRLIHFPDDFDPAKSVIEPLRQGVLYEV